MSTSSRRPASKAGEHLVDIHNPPARQRYPSKFVLSIANIQDELLEHTHVAIKTMGRNVDDQELVDSLIKAWVIHQMQRELYLSFDHDATFTAATEYFFRAPQAFFSGNRPLTEQFIGQVRPALSMGEDVPYNERICTVEFWLPDLTLKFL